MSEIKLDPEPKILIESLRDIGYSFNSALADIVDNSITANATHISIFAIPDSSGFKIAIIDDGEGLSQSDLKQAMKLGSSDPREKRAANDLGRFGLGLKTASFSQCRKLTVASRCCGSTSIFTWDLDLVVRENSWTVIERQNDSDVPFLDKLSDTGTLVLWECLDRLTGSRGSGKVDYARIISEAQEYLSLVFHRFLAGELGVKKLTIDVNGLELAPIDPFNSKHKATQVSPSEVVCPGVSMQAFTLPHRSNYESLSEYEKYGLVGGYLKSQGVYLYRAKRLILYGTWFGLVKKTALTQLCRVKIDIDVNQDEVWKIDVKKVSADMPEVVRTRIKSLIATLGAPSKKVYKRRGARLTSPDAYPAWSAVKEKEKTIYKINRSHPIISSLSDSLDEEGKENFGIVLSLIEATFPTESLFYEISKSEDNVSFAQFDETDFSRAAKTFFASLKQEGKEDESIVSLMGCVEPFASNWEATLSALGIKES